MQKPLSILFVSSEVSPFVNETPLSSFMNGLPISLKTKSNDVRIAVPRYGIVSDRNPYVYNISKLSNLSFTNYNGKIENFDVKSTSIQNTKTKVPIYAISCPKYFDNRKGIYTDPVKQNQYTDNLERFVFFSRAVVEMCAKLNWEPDIIHCSDWQTALIPAYVKYFHLNNFKKTKTVFTIHNFNSQGVFPIEKFNLLELPDDAKESYTHKQEINLIKGGMLYSNKITTPSPAYKELISKNKNYSNGLNTYIKLHYPDIMAINSGIDTNTWNPRKDTLIPVILKKDYIDFKQQNKEHFLSTYKINLKSDIPLISVISQFSEVNNKELLLELIPNILSSNDVIIFVQDTNCNPELKKQLTNLSKQFSKKLILDFSKDETVSHQLLAASDMTLHINQYNSDASLFQSAAIYGSVPITFLTGGIKDIAIPIKKSNINVANSFSITNLKVNSILDVVNQSIKTFNDKNLWHQLVKNTMSSDYCWDDSVNQYLNIYRNIIKH